MSTQVSVVDVQVRSKTGDVITHLPVDAANPGSITCDRTAAIRRTISSAIRIIDPTGKLMPVYATDTLHPYSGNELWVFRPDANGVPTALGVFELTTPLVHVGNDGWYLELSGSDRGLRVQRAAWTDLYSITGAPNLNSAATALLQNRMQAAGIPTSGPGSWALNFAPTDYTVPDTTFGVANGVLTGGVTNQYGTNPWSDLRALFTDAGEEVFFDAQGVVVAQPVPNPATSAPVATYTDGVGGTIVTIERALDLSKSYSGVLVIGQGSTIASPVTAIVWDPTSKALLGEVPYLYNSSNIATQAQAQQVAETLLPTVVAAQENVTVTAQDDPHRAASDVVRIVSDRGGVNAVYVLQQVEHPLGVNATMTLTTSRQVPA